MLASYQQVLVHLDATKSTGARLATARAIAQEQGAALAALYATVPVYLTLPFPPEGSAGPAEALMNLEAQWRTDARRIFDEAMRAPGPAVSWAEISELPVIGAFAEQAFFADLLVLGQRDPQDPASAALPPDFAESLLFASGRPALVLPYAWTRTKVGGTVAIAWKGTPEAARAVSAAMPLLQRAGRVHVLTWDEEPAPEIRGSALGLEGYLRLHGVETTWHRGGPASDDLGELLLSRVFDLEADLLVMGCYGHGRAREWVLGGVSRTILRSMTLPVLMAH